MALPPVVESASLAIADKRLSGVYVMVIEG
jgi:hypothetical protein